MTGQGPGGRFESVWSFPPLDQLPPDDELIALGADLETTTLLEAYASGYFPMPVAGTIGWFSPDPRGVLPLHALRVSRSLRRSIRRYEATVDQAFGRVVEACADPARPHGWINTDIIAAYARLHEQGWAHSVEVWADDELVGGLYGVTIGRFFAGESMFQRRNDASKVALVHLVELLGGGRLADALLDVQWSTPHLASLGVVEIPRKEYGRHLDAAIAAPAFDAFSD